MKVTAGKITHSKKIWPWLLLFTGMLSGAVASAQSKAQAANEVWQREVLYWQFVEKNDTNAYKKLWYKDFTGYASNEIIDTNHIASWITDLFKNNDVKYSVDLSKKAVNVVDNIVMTFYDEDDIYTNLKTGIVTRETYKITHTWKKYGNTWLIIGGMDGFKK